MESEDRTSYVRHWERKANEESYKSKLNKTNHIKWHDISNVGPISIEFVCT